MNNTGLRQKLILQTFLSTVIPLGILIALFSIGSMRMSDSAQKALLSSGESDLEHTAANIYAEANTARAMLEENIRKVMAFAVNRASEMGGFSANGSNNIEWTAVNQLDKKASRVTLPQMELGGRWLGQVSDPSAEVPLVDDIRRITGDTATVFQRMNPSGDMLRIATSVIDSDGRRAVGTFIASKNADGTPNKVLSEVVAGRNYIGRAFVVDRWYQTAYSPIRDVSGNVIGMLYVGTPEDVATAPFRERLKAMKIGRDGYVFIFNVKGADRGRYDLSAGGKRDGENVIDTKDASGRSIVREMVALADSTPKGQVSSYSYEWANQGDAHPRRKLAKLVYFEPWDWEIGVSTYEDDFLGPVIAMREATSRTIWTAVIFSILFAAIACTVVGFLVSRIVRRVELIAGTLRSGADETGSAARNVSASSEQLASGASEQASGIEETGATINELTAQTKANADSAGKARTLMRETTNLVTDADARMKSLNDSMQDLAEVSARTQKIVKTIDEIAFQTNILALNAAVEAARAGESGAGFAVVANEVRNLAQRAAEAARNTDQLINDSTLRITSGAEMAGAVSEAFSRVREKSESVTQLVDQIAEASADQQTGHEQIDKAIVQMSDIVQHNAAAAEESAAAAEELFSQSEMLLASVRELSGIIHGEKKDAETEAELRAAEKRRLGDSPAGSSHSLPVKSLKR
ncbi:MAG TPA: Cache 3/Cache 2 fusion domain-containing protein [Opitutales bacterium]|nr:Cache 3/Cache 2 fusion domain-containing protein [Opitutales bacterium]